MMDILRFITAGNVDDGKSTLIGRLLYETGNIKDDVLQSVSDDEALNLAHITDGLRSERAQGITIDVAYKYFTTNTRKYIVVDAPGHFQYTRNLVTGASGADAIIILVDALNGITEQTRQHSMVALFLGIKQVIVAINKMDALSYSEQSFQQIKADYDKEIATRLGLNPIFIPISALHGDNVITLSDNTAWYQGVTLLQSLEQFTPDVPMVNMFRFAVQYMGRDMDTQICLGKILSGMVAIGDYVSVFPEKSSGFVRKIIVGKILERDAAYAGENVCLFVDSGHLIERGEILCDAVDAPQISKEITATLCWLDTNPLVTGREYNLQMNSMDTVCVVTHIISKADNATFDQREGGTELLVNEFAIVKITTGNAIVFDAFEKIPAMGRGIIIDKETNYTSGAFTIH